MNPAASRFSASHRPWPVTLQAILLTIQGLVLAGIAAILMGGQIPEPFPVIPGWNLNVPFPPLAGLFTVLAIAILMTAVGFFRLWRLAWLLGVVVQGTLLLFGLIFYFNQKPWFVYPVLLSGILMVAFFQHPDVQGSFRVRD